MNLIKKAEFIFNCLQVLNYFREFQLIKGINLSENGFSDYPQCYFTINEEFSECLILEDLGRRKFEMANHRTESITFEHVSLLMKSLGRFHAISFALKDQQPKKFNELTHLTRERYWLFWTQPGPDTHYLSMIDRLKNVLKEENRFDLVEKFENVIDGKFAETVLHLVSSGAAEPFSVICHGDVTINNTMYRKDEQGKPVDIQIFDWQLSRYASPTIDLVLCLFCSTTKELRDDHYVDFLQIYHKSLSELLSR